tara:strand:+ start:210 stop:410 length:201 start_codon:yes stop_codon:yes gene_type:complete
MTFLSLLGKMQCTGIVGVRRRSWKLSSRYAKALVSNNQPIFLPYQFPARLVLGGTENFIYRPIAEI